MSEGAIIIRVAICAICAIFPFYFGMSKDKLAIGSAGAILSFVVGLVLGGLFGAILAATVTWWILRESTNEANATLRYGRSNAYWRQNVRRDVAPQTAVPFILAMVALAAVLVLALLAYA